MVDYKDFSGDGVHFQVQVVPDRVPDLLAAGAHAKLKLTTRISTGVRWACPQRRPYRQPVMCWTCLEARIIIERLSQLVPGSTLGRALHVWHAHEQ